MAAELESSEVPLPPVVLEAAGDDTDAAKSPETKKRKLGVPQQPGAGAGGYGGSLADTGGIEVEQLEADEFKFLDGATHLAVLQSGAFLACAFSKPHTHIGPSNMIWSINQSQTLK